MNSCLSVHQQNDCLIINRVIFNCCKYPSGIILHKIRYKHIKNTWVYCLLLGWFILILNIYRLFNTVWFLHRKLCERNRSEFKMQASLSTRNTLSQLKRKAHVTEDQNCWKKMTAIHHYIYVNFQNQIKLVISTVSLILLQTAFTSQI